MIPSFIASFLSREFPLDILLEVLVTNSFSFPLSENVLISSSILKNYNTASAEERRLHAFLLTAGKEIQGSHLTFTYIQSEGGSLLVGGGRRFRLLLGLPH